jgi:hypothetical protein
METSPGPPHAHNMKTLSRFFVLPLPILLVAFALTKPPQSVQARQSSQHGQPRDAIDLLLQAESPPLSDASRDITWHLLSSTYRIMETYEKARQYYETASHILNKPDYALALDNLGATKELTGLVDAAKAIRIMSKRLHQGICNRNSQVDLNTELASAETPRNTTPKNEATRVQQNTTPALTNVRAPRHGGCTMSAESFQ